MPRKTLSKAAEYRKRDYEKHREKRLHGQWVYWLRANYGLSPDDYGALLSQQGHSCAICKTPSDAHRTRLEVDHSHITGKVRGLLCHKCNKGLGLFSDNPQTLREASEYLVNAA